MHDCPTCGQACDCDMEDTYYDEAPDDCACECGQEEHEDVNDQPDWEEFSDL